MAVVVIGSGLLGVSTAYFLAKAGLQVQVLDRQPGPGLETSFANGGLLTPSLSDPWNAPGVARKMLGWLGHEDAPVLLRAKALPSLAGWGLQFLLESRPDRFKDNMASNLRLARYNVSVMEALSDTLSLDRLDGGVATLKVARDSASMDHMLDLSNVLSEQGLAFEVLNGAQCCLKEPALKPIEHELVGGLYCPEDGFGDAQKYCAYLSEAAQKLGAEFYFNTTVTGFRRQAGKVVAVETDQGPFETDSVVVAAGSYSGLLTRTLGVRLPVRPCKGYSLTVPIGGWTTPPSIPVIDDALHAVVTPLGDQLRVAGTAEFSGYDTQINPKRIANVKALMAQIYPEFMAHYSESDASPWTGLRPVSARGVPLIGRTGIDNLYVNTGHGHLGWSMAAGSGAALADMMLGKKPGIAMTDYGLKP